MASNQARLSRTLYRSLSRWCQKAPPDVSLASFQRQLADIPIQSPACLQQALKEAFRSEGGERKALVQEAIEGLRFLNELNVNTLPRSLNLPADDDLPGNHNETPTNIVAQKMMDTIEWLPAISDSQDTSSLSDSSSHLALFPLSGPTLPASSQEAMPLFTRLSDVPIPAMEIPLRIFEPRYRQMYHDIMASSSQDKRLFFVVPFSHPTLAGVYAKYALLYDIVRVDDVADQTNGQVHLEAKHLVTQTVRMDRIVNPSAWETEETYLRIDGEILQEDFVSTQKEFQAIESLLVDWKLPLAKSLLEGLEDDGIWGLVSVWISYLQMNVLQTQADISSQVRTQLDKNPETSADQVIRSLQAPYKQHLVALHAELATLMPRLLQLDQKKRCELMYVIIQGEKDRLQDLQMLSKAN